MNDKERRKERERQERRRKERQREQRNRERIRIHVHREELERVEGLPTTPERPLDHEVEGKKKAVPPLEQPVSGRYISIADRLTGNTSGKRIDFTPFVFVIAIITAFYLLFTVLRNTDDRTNVDRNQFWTTPQEAPIDPFQWKGTVHTTSNNRRIYTISTDGDLFATSPVTRRMKQLGSDDFKRGTIFFEHRGYLYLFQGNGEFHTVNPSGGAWRSEVRKPDGHFRTIAATVAQDSVIAVEGNGFMYATNLLNGGTRRVGKQEFSNTAFLFTLQGAIFSVERTGQVFAIDWLFGTKTQIGSEEKLKDIRSHTVVQNQLVFIDSEGTLNAYHPSSGIRMLVSPVSADEVNLLVSVEEQLFLITHDGQLLPCPL